MLKIAKIEKSQIGLIQLRRSIQLFNIGDYISAITLGGAANEIFGQFALKKQGYNVLDLNKSFWDDISEIIKKNKPSKGKIKQIDNQIKNSVKHHDSNDDIVVKADFYFEAQFQIDGAIKNYQIAFDTSPKDKVINRYINWYWR